MRSSAAASPLVIASLRSRSRRKISSSTFGCDVAPAGLLRALAVATNTIATAVTRISFIAASPVTMQATTSIVHLIPACLPVCLLEVWEFGMAGLGRLVAVEIDKIPNHHEIGAMTLSHSAGNRGKPLHNRCNAPNLSRHPVFAPVPDLFHAG